MTTQSEAAAALAVTLNAICSGEDFDTILAALVMLQGAYIATATTNAATAQAVVRRQNDILRKVVTVAKSKESA